MLLSSKPYPNLVRCLSSIKSCIFAAMFLIVLLINPLFSSAWAQNEPKLFDLSSLNKQKSEISKIYLQAVSDAATTNRATDSALSPPSTSTNSSAATATPTYSTTYSTSSSPLSKKELSPLSSSINKLIKKNNSTYLALSRWLSPDAPSLPRLELTQDQSQSIELIIKLIVIKSYHLRTTHQPCSLYLYQMGQGFAFLTELAYSQANAQGLHLSQALRSVLLSEVDTAVNSAPWKLCDPQLARSWFLSQKFDLPLDRAFISLNPHLNLYEKSWNQKLALALQNNPLRSTQDYFDSQKLYPSKGLKKALSVWTAKQVDELKTQNALKNKIKQQLEAAATAQDLPISK